MELISRILDGSIPESLRASLPPSGSFGGRVTQDDKIARLEEVTLLEECSRKQLKAVAKITEVIEVPAGPGLGAPGEAGTWFYPLWAAPRPADCPGRVPPHSNPGTYSGR